MLPMEAMLTMETMEPLLFLLGSLPAQLAPLVNGLLNITPVAVIPIVVGTPAELHGSLQTVGTVTLTSIGGEVQKAELGWHNYPKTSQHSH